MHIQNNFNATKKYYFYSIFYKYFTYFLVRSYIQLLKIFKLKKDFHLK